MFYFLEIIRVQCIPEANYRKPNITTCKPCPQTKCSKIEGETPLFRLKHNFKKKTTDRNAKKVKTTNFPTSLNTSTNVKTETSTSLPLTPISIPIASTSLPLSPISIPITSTSSIPIETVHEKGKSTFSSSPSTPMSNVSLSVTPETSKKENCESIFQCLFN